MNRIFKNKAVTITLIVVFLAASTTIAYLFIYPDATDKNNSAESDYIQYKEKTAPLIRENKFDEIIQVTDEYLTTAEEQEYKCGAYNTLTRAYLSRGDTEKGFEVVNKIESEECEMDHFFYADISYAYQAEGNNEAQKEYLQKAISAIPEDDPLGQQYKSEYESALNDIE